MNIIEAVKSGKRFRRKTWGVYVFFSKYGFIEYEDGESCILEKIDITSDDWEVEEEKKELTRAQVYDALYEARYLIDSSTNKILVGLGFDEKT